MALLFEDKIPNNRPQFVAKVNDVASKLQIDANWLMAMMWNESGLKSDTSNSINCVGLIGFCPDTSGGAYKTINGTPVYMSALREMSNVDQLDYVLQLYYPYRNKLTRFVDLYLFNFYPVAMGKSDDFVIGSEKDIQRVANVAIKNPTFDLNKDKKITVGEFKQYVKNKFKDYPALFKSDKSVLEKKLPQEVLFAKYAKRNWLLLFFGVLLLAAGIFYIVYYKKHLKKK